MNKVLNKPNSKAQRPALVKKIKKFKHNQDFTLHRSVLIEKSFPELLILQKALSGMVHMKPTFYIHGELIIILLESSWAGKRIFGPKSGIVYVMGFIITKYLLKTLINISIPTLDNLYPEITLKFKEIVHLRCVFMLNFKENIQIIENFGKTSMYAIPIEGKSIFLNTFIDIFNNNNSVRLSLLPNSCVWDLNAALPMHKLAKGSFIPLSDVSEGHLTKLIHPIDKKELTVYLKKVSKWRTSGKHIFTTKTMTHYEMDALTT